MAGMDSAPGKDRPDAPEETLFAPGPCALCGRNPAVGFASIGDKWYCHGDHDPEPTCYMRGQSIPLTEGSKPWAFLTINGQAGS